MTRQHEVSYEGFRAARDGHWPGDNPYQHYEPEFLWWREGFTCWHQGRRTRPEPWPVELGVAGFLSAAE